MQDKKFKYSIILILVAGIGIYAYNNTEKRTAAKKENCTEIGLKLGEENRVHLKNLGQDKTDFYKDEFTYSGKLDTCLYYKEQTPFMYDAENEVAFALRKVINASTNEEILSFFRILNPEGLDDELKRPTCISYHENFKCSTESDFNKIKAELFR